MRYRAEMSSTSCTTRMTALLCTVAVRDTATMNSSGQARITAMKSDSRRQGPRAALTPQMVLKVFSMTASSDTTVTNRNSSPTEPRVLTLVLLM